MNNLKDLLPAGQVTHIKLAVADSVPKNNDCSRKRMIDPVVFLQGSRHGDLQGQDAGGRHRLVQGSLPIQTFRASASS